MVNWCQHDINNRPDWVGAVLKTPLRLFNNSVANSSFSSHSSKPLSFPNRKSYGAEIFRECSPYTVCHISHVLCYILHITCHTYPVTLHVSCVIFFLQSCGASSKKVYYQVLQNKKSGLRPKVFSPYRFRIQGRSLNITNRQKKKPPHSTCVLYRIRSSPD